MKIFCTGISGSNREKYLESVVKHSEEQDKKVNLYSVGRLMKEFCKNAGIKYNWDNILNVPENERILAVYGAIEEIIQQSKRQKDVIISTHARFYWKGIAKKSENHRYLDLLNPDIFITIIDSAKDIKERLDNRKQWSKMELSTDDILSWQNEEVNSTSEWADFMNKPIYIIAANEPPSFLYDLIFHSEKEVVYSSFPMTHLKDEKIKEDIQDFILKLREYFIVNNPATIEVGKQDTSIVFGQTFNRDLEWFIKNNSVRTIIYFPEAVLSTGVISEALKTMEYTKENWLVAPKGILHGPFESVVIDKRFYSKDEFFKFLEKEYSGC